MCKTKTTLRRCCSLSSKILKSLSIGKVSLGLHFEGKLQYSTLIGGFISLGFILGMIAYFFIIMIPIFNRQQYTIESKIIQIPDNDKILDFTLRDIYPFFQMTVQLKESDYKICDNVFINVTYQEGLTFQDIGSYQMIDRESQTLNSTSCSFIPINNDQFQFDMTNFINTKAIYLKSKIQDVYGFTLSYVVNASNYTTENIDIYYYQSIISNSGNFTERNMIEIPILGKNLFQVFYKLIDYFNSDSIVGWLEDYKESILLKENSRVSRQLLGRFDNIFTIYFLFDNSIYQFKRQPLTLFNGISQIGGLFGFIKILGILVSLVHLQLFRRNLKKHHLSQLDQMQASTNNQDKHEINEESSSLVQTLQMDQQSMNINTVNQSSYFDIKSFYSFDSFKQMKLKQDEKDEKEKAFEEKINTLSNGLEEFKGKVMSDFEMVRRTNLRESLDSNNTAKFRRELDVDIEEINLKFQKLELLIESQAQQLKLLQTSQKQKED